MQGTGANDKEINRHEDKINKAHENKRAREQDNNISKRTRKTYYTRTRTKNDTNAEKRRTREQIIKERVQENKGTSDKRTKSSVGGFSPHDVSSERTRSDERQEDDDKYKNMAR